MKTIKELLMEQRERHGWKEYHNPKDLAVALNIETSELLENFLWKENKDLNEEDLEKIGLEIADVFSYLFYLSDTLGIDINEVVENKVKINNERFKDGWKK